MNSLNSVPVPTPNPVAPKIKKKERIENSKDESQISKVKWSFENLDFTSLKNLFSKILFGLLVFESSVINIFEDFIYFVGSLFGFQPSRPYINVTLTNSLKPYKVRNHRPLGIFEFSDRILIKKRLKNNYVFSSEADVRNAIT